MERDWSSLYTSIRTTAHLPESSPKPLNAVHSIIQEMFVDLSVLHDQFFEQSLTPSYLTIYADVVRFPENFSWVLKKCSVSIFARRVEVGDTARVTLDYRESKSANLTFYTQEFTAPLLVKATTMANGNRETVEFTVDRPLAIGTEVTCRNEQPELLPVETLNAPYTDNGSYLHRSLNTSFLYATVLLHSMPEIAASMFAWIRACAAQAPAFTDLFMQSSTLYLMLKTAQNNASFVPTLSTSVYTQSVAAYVATVQEYERQYERFSDKNSDLKTRQEAAKLMLDHAGDKTRWQAQLVKQCQTNIEAAEKAIEESMRRLEKQQRVVEIAAIKFKYDLERWKEQQEMKAAFAIIGALIEFAAGIGAMIATAGAAAPATAAAATGAVAQVAEVASQT
ncbi:MAG: hypothetical protein ACXVPC_08120, partial [Tumebacillaceae bacterium]